VLRAGQVVDQWQYLVSIGWKRASQIGLPVSLGRFVDKFSNVPLESFYFGEDIMWGCFDAVLSNGSAKREL
jgi:hypothetical protein